MEITTFEPMYDKNHYPNPNSHLVCHCYACGRVLMCDRKVCPLEEANCNGYHTMCIPRSLNFICGKGECMKYKLPQSGKEVKITACESMALDILFENYNEDDISMNHQINDEFIASIYIHNENRIIEATTIGLIREYTNIIKLKKNTMYEKLRSENYIVEIWLFNINGYKIISNITDEID